MSPVSPVFHTEESVRLSLNSKVIRGIKMSILEQRALEKLYPIIQLTIGLYLILDIQTPSCMDYEVYL